jgi:large subunit ribosomal protein L10
MLENSKMTVVAEYRGTSVKAMQTLRSQAKDNSTVVKVIKNRLVLKALEANPALKDLDKSLFNDMLMYAFNSEDELGSPQAIANFAKLNPNVKIVGAFTSEGEFISADDTKALASLPTKDQLRGQLVGLIAAPLTGFVGVLSGNIRGVLNVLSAHADQIS